MLPTNLKLRFSLCVISLLTFLNAGAYELEYEFKNYGVNEGLPSSQVYEIIQDSRGYIWFGTDRGVVCYNGYEFKTYTVEDGLTSNVVFKLDEGPNGQIWFYSKDQKMSFLEKGQVKLFKYNDSLTQFIDTRDNFLSMDVSKTGLTLCNWNQGTEASFFSVNYTQKNKIISNHGSGVFIYGSGQNVHVSATASGAFHVYYNERELELKGRSDFNYFTSYKLFANVVRTKDHFYLTIAHELYEIDEDKGTATHLHSFDNDVLDLKADHKGNIYLGLSKGGLCLLPDGDLDKRRVIIPDIRVSNICIDKDNGIWVASLYNGIFYNSSRKHVKVKGCDPFLRWDKQGDKIISINNSNVIKTLEGKELASGSSLNLPLECRKLYYSNRTNYRFDSIHGHSVVGTSALSFYDDSFQKKKTYYFFDNYVNCAFFDHRRGVNLLGTDSGVKRVNLKKAVLKSTNGGAKSFVFLEPLEGYRDNSPFFRSKMRDIRWWNDSTIMFASAEKGVYIERLNGKAFWLNQKKGLVGNAIDRIYIEDGYAVFLTKEGVTLLNEDNTLINYTNKNGLLSNEAYDAIIRNDSIWISTDEGVSVFKIQQRKYPPIPVYLKSFEINGSKKELLDDYELDYDQNILDLSFEGLSYIQEGNINYKYKLQGVDQNWVNTQNRSVRYTNLPSGNFTFWVTAQNLDRSWTTPVCLFHVFKPIPFWQHTWFNIAIVLVLIAISWLIIYWRYQRLKKIQQTKQRVLNLERKTLQAQMNPHFMFNSLTSLQNLIIQDRKDESQEYLGKFARLTRLALNHSTKNRIELTEEIELLRNYIELEQTRYNNSFSYEFHIQLTEQQITISPMLIQPFVENAILHGLSARSEGGLLTIRFLNRDKSTIWCEIEDNGIGRQNRKSVKGKKSLGIQLVKERLKILVHGDAVTIIDLFDYDEPKGTKVVLIIPFKTTYDESLNS